MFVRNLLLSAIFSLAIAVGPAYCATTFDGERAITHLRAQCEFGPRVPGTPAYEQTKDYLKKELSRWADEVQEQKFQARIG
ncbi:MAG: hypothetical protein GTO55_09065, partial [Armatimonadetes bacterium]|nr:hypothetical protein [Armatimonadota bacterium]NIM22731.1 hypothetical protein [Armatimonadota bacterium]NIM68267.1 hypothetical protein [Armatimonadota bacterium]NIN04781.1 hypothetical protein [Armatimonadota bacterium]NIO98053.1 hypothetical protein [Armatimonadota bacterium]